MSFSGNSITVLAAADLTANYRSNHPSAVQGFYYGQSAINAILAQDDCVGIRIYFGEDEFGNPKLVICGVLADENDILPGELAEYGTACPPSCGSTNALNS